MKKVLLMLSLLVVVMFVVSCAPGEDALAGEAIGKSPTGRYSLIEIKEQFVLNDAVGKPHTFQYMGADAPSAEGGKIRLKNMETGETINLDYLYQAYAGGIKGAYLGVGIHQAYAGGIKERQDYWLVLSESPTSTIKNAKLKINPSSDDTRSLLFKNVPAEWKYMPTGCYCLVELLSGESMNCGPFEIKYVWQDYAGGIKAITIDDEITDLNPTEMSLGEDWLSSGKGVMLLDSFNQDYAGGIHSATVCLIK